MDRRLLIGVVLVIVLGVAAYAIFMGEEPPSPTNGNGNGNGDDNGDGDGNGAVQITINGIVSDEAGDPIQGATVSLDGKTETTNEEGEYSFEVDAGNYTLTVEAEGFDPENSTIEVLAGEEYIVDFSLPEIPQTDAVELKIITRHGFDILYRAREAFLVTDIAEEYNIEKITFLGVSSTLWVDTIDRSGDIDLAWGGGPVVFDVIDNEGQLAPLTSDVVTDVMDDLPNQISGVPAKRIRDEEVYWVGSAVASFGFTINKDFLESYDLPTPRTWKDLANETYAVTLPSISSIGTADATLSTSNTRMFEIIFQTYDWVEGWKLLTLKGANARIFDRSESVRDAAIQGTIGAGTTIDFYGYTAQLQNPEFCEYVLPEDGTLVNADPIAMVSTTDNPEAAQAFIAWVLSPDGQKIWLDPNINRLPMNPEVFNTPEGQARQDLEDIYDRTQEALIIEFSDSLALTYETSMMYFYHASIVRPQDNLVDVWTEMTIALEEGEITHEEFISIADDLGNPHEFEFRDPETGETETFTQEYAQDINDRIRDDATFKQQMIDTWSEAAEDRYDAAMEELQQLIS
jgi:ABC-type Fe3+ transport system substrate-binding protein